MRDFVDAAILSTLAYAAVFDAPVPLSLFDTFLISNTSISSTRLRTHLKRLKKAGIVAHQMDLYAFATDSHLLTHDYRDESQQKQESIRAFITILKHIPWICGIAITGSVAVGNAKKEEDIDLMIITNRERLWLTRALVLVLFGWTGRIRLSGSSTVQDKLCLNLWMDEHALALEKKDLYVAREVVQAQWIYDTKKIQKRLLAANPWIKNYLGNAPFPRVKDLGHQELPHNYRIFTALNHCAYRLQRWFIQKHRTREIVELHRAFFHPQDVGRNVLLQYKKVLDTYRRAYNRLQRG